MFVGFHFASGFASSGHYRHSLARPSFDVTRGQSVCNGEVGGRRPSGIWLDVKAAFASSLIEVVKQQRHGLSVFRIK